MGLDNAILWVENRKENVVRKQGQLNQVVFPIAIPD